MTDTTLAAAEAAAPIDTAAPLPYEVDTLAYIPTQHRDQYVRQMNGSFRLDYVHADDEKNQFAHTDHLAAGVLRILPVGMNRSQAAEEEARQQAFGADLLQQVDQMHEAELARRKAIRLQTLDRAHELNRKRLAAGLDPLPLPR